MRTPILFTILAAAASADWKDSLLFYAPFDKSTDAAKAAGDPKLYHAPTYKEQAQAKPSLEGSEVEWVKKGGRRGGALRFHKKNVRAIFYKAEKNVAFQAKGWEGTISFWLNLDPETELEPGFCDPIQVTDSAYNDSAIWVDFTKDDKPRHFRLGVFGELKPWNPKNLASDKNPDFNNRLVVVSKHPFAKGKWTHVAITHRGLGGSGEATLYLDGKAQGTARNIGEAFEWDPAKGAIRLGVAYVGLMDEVAVFSKALSADEIGQLHRGKM